MFNVSTIEDAFITLVRWEKDNNPEGTNNPMGDLLTGSSGLTYNSQNPLLTMENLSSVSDVFSSYTYPAYSSGTTYAKGDIVTNSGLKYVSVVNENVGNATSSTTHWRLTTPFNEWLRKKTAGSIVEMLHDWFNLKKELGTIKNLLKVQQLLSIPGNKIEGVGTTSRYCGLQIIPNPVKGTVLKIDRACIHMFDSENVTLTLYKNGVATSNTKELAGSGGANPIWMECGWELEPGNVYLLAYDRNDLSTAEPINGLVHVNRNDWPYNRFPYTMPYAEVAAFSTDDLTQDLTDSRINFNNYGINISLSAKCDYTEFLVDQKTLFASALAKKVAINFLSELRANPKARINRNALSAEQGIEIYLEINGNPNTKSLSLKKEYTDALKSIALDFVDLPKECFPCRKSIRYTTV